MCTLPVSVAPFTSTGFANPTATPSSANLELPTNGSSTPPATRLLVTNLSDSNLFIALGTDDTVEATAWEDALVQQNEQRLFIIGSATYVAYVLDTDPTRAVFFETGY